MMPVHPPGRSLSDTLAEDTAKSILADKLGYDELWMGEHFSATTEPFPSPLMFLAGLVPQTKNLTFGTAVINLPNHHPAIVAGEAAQFDHMSGGRFLFGVGSGGLASDFELFKIDPATRQRAVHGIDRHDPAHLGAGPALRHPGRILERADQEGDPARAWRRLHAEAVAEAASADPHLDRQPRHRIGEARRLERLGRHLGDRSRRSMRSRTTGRPTAKPAREAGKRARSEDWRVSRAHHRRADRRRGRGARLRRARLEPLSIAATCARRSRRRPSGSS